jgi:hypothetical protein
MAKSTKPPILASGKLAAAPAQVRASFVPGDKFGPTGATGATGTTGSSGPTREVGATGGHEGVTYQMVAHMISESEEKTTLRMESMQLGLESKISALTGDIDSKFLKLSGDIEQKFSQFQAQIGPILDTVKRIPGPWGIVGIILSTIVGLLAVAGALATIFGGGISMGTFVGDKFIQNQSAINENARQDAETRERLDQIIQSVDGLVQKLTPPPTEP